MSGRLAARIGIASLAVGVSLAAPQAAGKVARHGELDYFNGLQNKAADSL